MIKYKIDILAALKAAGYSTARLRKDKIFGEATLQKMRQRDTNITLDTIDRLCDAVPPPFLFRWDRITENDVADIHINRKCVGFTEVAEDLLVVDLGEQFQGRLRVKHLPCCIHHVFARR